VADDAAGDSASDVDSDDSGDVRNVEWPDGVPLPLPLFASPAIAAESAVASPGHTTGDCDSKRESDCDSPATKPLGWFHCDSPVAALK
jgi:hypothetical protein